MTHKTNPKILRIFGSEDWLSKGFYRKNFPQFLEEDFKIRNFLIKKFPKTTIESIEIERETGFLKIIIKTARPAFIIGRSGDEVKKLKKEIEKLISQSQKKTEKKDIKIEIIAIKDPWSSASLASQWVAIQIEKRVPFRRTLKMAISKIMASNEVKGVKISASGRLNGVSIHRREWLQEGQLPRQKIRGIIDYGFAEAHCSYGVIGIKVWIYKGEKLE